MDTTDGTLLGALQEDPLLSFESLGRATGLSGAAVKQRYRRLRADGILQGIALLPHPGTLGRLQTILHFRPSDNPPDLQAALELPDVYFAKRAHDGGTTLIAACTDAPDGLVDAGTQLFGAAPHAVHQPDTERPRPAHTLSPLQWRLIIAWAPEPRTTTTALAHAARLTPKTVRHHRTTLLQKRLVQAVPLVNAAQTTGAIFHGIAIHAADTHSLDAAIRTLQETQPTHVSNRFGHPPNAYVWSTAEHFPALSRIGNRLRALPGIHDVHVTVPAGMRVHQPRIQEWIQKETRRWAAPAST